MYQTPEHWFQPSALVLLVFSVAVAAVACCSCPWWRCRGCPFFPCKFESFAQNQLLCSIKRFSSEFLLESLYRYFVQLMQPKNVTLCCCCCTQPFISFLPGKTWILSLFQKKSRVYRCKTHKAKKKNWKQFAWKAKLPVVIQCHLVNIRWWNTSSTIRSSSSSIKPRLRWTWSPTWRCYWGFQEIANKFLSKISTNVAFSKVCKNNASSTG